MATDKLTLGSRAPEFNNLPGTNGEKHSLKSFSGNKCVVVVFSCNHCPYVQAYEARMIAFQKEYAPKGVQLVAINSNETVNYPEDNFEEMVKRAQRQGFNFPYLRDDDQSVATAFGATHTPEFFLFDQQRTLRYHGKMDDNYQNPGAVKLHFLRNAVEAVLAGGEVKDKETYSIGCTIKWK
jgi:peroxiredoxin